MAINDYFADPESVINSVQSAQSNATQSFPEAQGEYGMAFTFADYNVSAVMGSTNVMESPRGSIVLPMPLNIDETLNIDSKQANLGLKGAGALALLDGENTLGQVASDIFDTAKDMAGSLASDIFGQGDTLNDVRAALRQTGSFARLAARGSIGQELGLAADVYAGTAVNPYATVDFDGVRLRQHDFSWSLSPNSEEESNTLRNIINTFRINILPAYQGVGGVSGGTVSRALLKYPSLVQPTLIGVDSSYYLKYKPSMITNVTVKYNEGPHLAVYRGGRPITVDLTVSMIETQIHTREDYGGEGGGTGTPMGWTDDSGTGVG